MGECKECGAEAQWFCKKCGAFYCQRHRCGHRTEEEVKKALVAQRRKVNPAPENIYQHTHAMSTLPREKKEEPEKKREPLIIATVAGILAALGMLVIGSAAEIKVGVWRIVLVGFGVGMIAYAVAAPDEHSPDENQ
jgi:hypothetical protein